MTSRNLVKLFFSTLLIGGLTTGIAGFFIRWKEFEQYVVNLEIIEILMVLIWLIGVGLIFSLISQMGFFAYLTVHRFGLGIFKSAKLWNSVQVVLIGFVLFDLVYLRYISFAKKGEGMFPYLALACIVLLVGIIVAYFKAKQTNKEAFIPALFFMVVVTTIEWVPVLRPNEKSWVYLMGLALLVCNAYQLLTLHKINEKSNLEREEKAKLKASQLETTQQQTNKKQQPKMKPQPKIKPSK
ncbi:KinB-signaling pathway activation protein [Pseudoneobacillus sp. C159]